MSNLHKTQPGQTDALSDAVAAALRVLSYACLKWSNQFDPDNPAQVGVYSWACRNAGVTPEAVELASKTAVRTLSEWPTAGQFAALCEEAMGTLRARELARYVPCIDVRGNVCAAPPERVRNGQLLPEGDLSGDGSPAPARSTDGEFCRHEFWAQRLAEAEAVGQADRVRFAKGMLDMLMAGDDDERRRSDMAAVGTLN